MFIENSIFVEVWSEIDPTIPLVIDRAANQPLCDPADQLQRVSPLGRAGIDAALGFGVREVVAFALGDGHGQALRHALAAGADRAIEIIVEDGSASSPSLGMVAAWLTACRPSLVIGGPLAGRLAARLGWSHLAGLAELQLERGSLVALRSLGRGHRERVRARLPAAVRLDEHLAAPPYIARSRMHQTEGRIERVVLAPAEPIQHAVEMGAWQPARPRVRLSQPAGPARPAARGLDRLQSLLTASSPGGAPGAPAPTSAQPRAGAAGALEGAALPDGAADSPAVQAERLIRFLAHHQLLAAPPDGG